MHFLKLIILTVGLLSVIGISAVCQNTHRQHENSLHNSSFDDVLVEKIDSNDRSFMNKLIVEIAAGPTISFFRGGEDADQIAFHRYCVALSVIHQTTEKLSLEVKILWEPKGTLTKYRGLKYGLEDHFYEQGLELNYLTLAFAIDHYIDCKRRLYIGAGASVGMLTRQWNFTYIYDNEGRKVSSYRAEAFAYRKFEMGLIANVGYRRQVWRKLRVNAQIFGNLGITDVTKKLNPDPYPEGSYNTNLALLIGIGIEH